MGSSALRAMAFAKPLIVQGEYGFWELLTPDSAPTFLRQGWYGIGSDAGDRGASSVRLQKILGGLLGDRTAWPGLGDYGRKLIVERFSLDHAAARHEQLYLAARESPDRPSAPRLGGDILRSGALLATYKVHRKFQRWRGTAPVDDFNAVSTILRQEVPGESHSAR
jgi:hypothetical protein